MRTADTLVGIITAASEALEGGFALADPNVARESASHARRAAARAPEVAREADALRRAIPAPTLRIASESVARHWRAYEEALANASTTDQIVSIQFALLACLNKELEKLREHEATLPPGVMKRWWMEYGAQSAPA